MKKLILITISILIFSTCFSQSVVQSNAEAEIKEIKLNLHKAHKQFKVGTIIFGFSLPFIVAGFAVEEKRNDSTKAILTGIGGLFMLTGGFIQIDCHKYIGKAGREND